MSLVPFSDTVQEQFWLQRPDGDDVEKRELQDHCSMAGECLAGRYVCQSQIIVERRGKNPTKNLGKTVFKYHLHLSEK